MARSLFDSLLGKSKAMQSAFGRIRLAASSQTNVLIVGESGTGKKLVAQAIHRQSGPAERPFARVRADPLSGTLLDASLFGHAEGAWFGTGAARKGLFELARGGSIVLDEIGDMPLDVQAKLLRAAREKEFTRLGGVEILPAGGVRILAASSVDLEERVAAGKFREDLYNRLNPFTIQLPPLRQRTEDIPLLVRNFLARYFQVYSKYVAEPSLRTMDALREYSWPGNVPELEEALEWVVGLSTEGRFEEELLPPWVSHH